MYGTTQQNRILSELSHWGRQRDAISKAIVAYLDLAPLRIAPDADHHSHHFIFRFRQQTTEKTTGLVRHSIDKDKGQGTLPGEKETVVINALPQVFCLTRQSRLVRAHH